MARFVDRSRVRQRGRSNREYHGPTTQCNDVARIGQFRHLSRSVISGAPSGGPWAKTASGKFKRNQADGTRNESASTAMFLKLNTRWPLGAKPTFPPDRARHRRRPSTIFRPRSDGVTGYVTSSHWDGNAVALRRNWSFGRKSAGAVEAGNHGPARSLRQRRGSSLPSLDSPYGAISSSFEIVTEEP
jgi:hypothetical protein